MLLFAETASPIDELNALLSHPLLLAFGTLFAAWLASRIVHEQVRKMGVEQVDANGKVDGFGWTSFFAAVTFWTVTILGLLAISANLELAVVGTFLTSALELLLRAIMAGAILAGAGACATALAEPNAAKSADPKDQARARRERTTILLVGGALAIGAATGLSLGTWIMVAIFGIPAVLLLRSAAYRKKAADGFANFGAGLRLREEYNRGSRITVGQRTVELLRKSGMFQTWVRDDGHKQLMGNAELLSLTATAEPEPTDEAEAEADRSDP